jgi:hypothetical protein
VKFATHERLKAIAISLFGCCITVVVFTIVMHLESRSDDTHGWLLLFGFVVGASVFHPGFLRFSRLNGREQDKSIGDHLLTFILAFALVFFPIFAVGSLALSSVFPPPAESVAFEAPIYVREEAGQIVTNEFFTLGSSLGGMRLLRNKNGTPFLDSFPPSIAVPKYLSSPMEYTILSPAKPTRFGGRSDYAFASRTLIIDNASNDSFHLKVFRHRRTKKLLEELVLPPGVHKRLEVAGEGKYFIVMSSNGHIVREMWLESNWKGAVTVLNINSANSYEVKKRRYDPSGQR